LQVLENNKTSGGNTRRGDDLAENE